MRHVLALAVLTLACDHSTSHGPEEPVVVETTPPKVETPPPATAPTPPAPRTPEALAALLVKYDALVAAGDPAASQLRAELDRVAGQRDAHTSRLFWHTDLDAAKAEAQRTGKPILSLRLLGRLDEELSCANSRMFRIALYSNPEVSGFMRDTYVLHWSTERPVPQITLDFGDGRVVRRTITGNSVHYVLDARGRIVDALPGLYGPAAFEKGLRESLDLAKQVAELSDDDSTKAVAKYHQSAVWKATAAWRRHLARAYWTEYGAYTDYIKTAHLPKPLKFSWPNPLYDSLPAQAVNELTMTKADLEAPDLVWMQPDVTVTGSYGDWAKIAKGAKREKLHEQSRALVVEKSPRDWNGRDAKPLDAAQLAKRFERFERRITEEELRNEFVFHAAVHKQLSKPERVAFTATNDFIYTSVFMTPQSDAWLGLMPTETITGLPNDGIVAKQ